MSQHPFFFFLVEKLNTLIFSCGKLWYNIIGIITANPPGVWPVFTLPTRGLKLYTLST